MLRKHFRHAPFAAFAALALLASGAALADDNSMSQWTGESYAYFNNLDYSLGAFNVARAPQPQLAHGPAAQANPHGEGATHAVTPPRPSHAMARSPFRDDTGA